MMNYELFKKEVETKFLSYMPDRLKNATVSVIPVEKVNIKLDGLLIKYPDKTCLPIIYINDLYKHYMVCNDFDTVIMSALNSFLPVFDEVFNIGDIDEFLKNGTEKITFQLINTEKNSELLSTLPHREFLDLSIIYRLIVKNDASGVHSIKITKELAKMIDMDESQLYDMAVVNTEKLFPPVVKNLVDITRQSLIEDGFNAEMIDELIPITTSPMPMIIITNNRNLDGAAVILYKNVLNEIANKLKSDLYLLPSSIHEIIAIQAGDDPDILSEIVSEINKEEVSDEDILSDSVYLYRRETGKITIANSRK